jgi:hypothetical protein
MMKKTILLLVLLFTFTHAFCQETEWSGWASISCYKGFQASVRKLGYVKTVNQYAHQARIKNNYRQKVSFDLFWTVAGERLSIGRVTLNPNDVYEHTSRYFSKDASMMFVEVDKVSFGDKLNCYASCDNGTPNQPNCDTKIATTQGQATTTTATAHNTAGGTSTTATSYPVQTPTNTAGAQQQQVLIQQQELQRQQQLQQGIDQVAQGIVGLITANQTNKARKRQEELANFQADKQLVADANNGDFSKQVKLAEVYVDHGQFTLAEYYYGVALQNAKETESNRNDILDEYITTLALQGKKKEMADVFGFIRNNHINNSNANIAFLLLEVFCEDFAIDAIICGDSAKADGVRGLLAMQADSAWVKPIICYMQVTGGYEKYGVPKDKEGGMKMLESMTKKRQPHDVALYYLGMIYLNGTPDIKKNEWKSWKYFLKSAYLNGGLGDYRQAPFKLNGTYAYINYRLFSYIKAAWFFSKYGGGINASMAAIMHEEVARYRFMIPESDKQYFPGFWQ